MPFKFDMPVKLPRFTSEEFEARRQAYVAKHGYTISVPGFEDIIDWYPIPEPTPAELILYNQKNISLLGERRYYNIKTLMTEKRENFLRMLSSPTPRIVQNAGSIMCALDDVNDTLGTLGVICRIAAQKLPHMLAKMLAGPAFWLFTAADIMSIMGALSRLPWKARRIQHEMHRTVRNNSPSKKARLRTLNKLKRKGISKGEIIEALQVTDNVFGIGICLGPIVGLLYDIPFGFYRHIRGDKVTVKGMPAPFYWFDRLWTSTLKTTASLWTDIPEISDRQKAKSMVAFNMATQVMHSIPPEQRDLDNVPDIADIEIPAPRPRNPSTQDVISSEVPDIEEHIGWLPDGQKWINPAAVWNASGSSIISNIEQWYQRNKSDTESYICNQNAIEAGLNAYALAETDDDVEWDFDAVSMATLQMLNMNYRLPPDASPEQTSCFASALHAYDQAGIHPSMHELVQLANVKCNLQFTTQVPLRSSVPYTLLSEKYDASIYRLQKWYFKGCVSLSEQIYGKWGRENPHLVTFKHDERNKKIKWLELYGWEIAQVNFYYSTWNDKQKNDYAW